MSNDIQQAIDSIRQHGYARIPAVFDKTVIDETLALVKSTADSLKHKTIHDIPRLDAGQDTLYNLQNKHIHFLKLLLGCDSIRRVLTHFLNDPWHRAIDLSEPNYILRSYSARNNQVAAPMHIDSFVPYMGEHVIAMQAAIILEDQAVDNGCTTVIAGSHQSGDYVSQQQAEIATPIESSAGDVVLWDSRIWHGTLQNNSGESRWSLIATFVRWWIKQGYRITENLPQDIYAQLGDSDKAVLGYCSRPLDDEYDGIDFKQGYDWLKPKVSDY
jgi:ectoine hydroxylase-related dioxygenase (phytanoyl-CoA dioxygenase family)